MGANGHSDVIIDIFKQVSKLSSYHVNISHAIVESPLALMVSYCQLFSWGLYHSGTMSHGLINDITSPGESLCHPKWGILVGFLLPYLMEAK